jgi:hypothetical protein
MTKGTDEAPNAFWPTPTSVNSVTSVWIGKVGKTKLNGVVLVDLELGRHHIYSGSGGT